MRHRFFLVLFLVSLLLSYIYASSPKKEAAMTERKSIKGIVYKAPWNKEGQYVIETDEFNVLLTADFDDYVLSKGARIKASVKLSVPVCATNPGEFDYRKYLLGKGVKYQAYVSRKDIEILDDNPASLTAWGASVRTRMSASLKKYLGDRSALAMAIMTGEAKSIDDNLKESIHLSGLAHLMAVSGTHVIMFLTPFMKGLRIKYLNIWVRNILLVLPLLFFLVVTGMTPSVFRAVMSQIMGIIALLLGRKRDSLNVLGFVGIMQILRNPYSIYDLGFILSYSCAFSIYIIQPAVVRFFEKKGYRSVKTGGGSGRGRGGYEKSKVLSISLDSFFTGISVNMGLFPVMWNVFNRINLVGVLFTCIAGPIASGILVIGYLLCLVDFLHLKYLAVFLSYILHSMLYFMTKVMESSSFLPQFLTEIIVPSKGLTLYILYYLLIVLFLIKNSKKKIEIPKIYVMRGIPAFMAILIILTSAVTEVVFFDVGQGNSIFISTKCGVKGLVDAGEGFVNVSQLLLKRGTNKLDFVVVSHGHSDHYGGVYDVLDIIKVNYLFIPDNEYDEEVMKIAEYAKRKGVKVVYVSNKTVYEAGSSFYSEILFYKDIASLNNSSLVIKLKLEQKKMLFCSDIEKEAESYYIRMNEIEDCDIIQVAHHGSNTSSTPGFVERARPEVAVVSVGRKNKFGHPDDIVLERFKDCELYRTDHHGAVIIKVKGKSIRIQKYL
jgi:competence protein ComEC